MALDPNDIKIIQEQATLVCDAKRAEIRPEVESYATKASHAAVDDRVRRLMRAALVFLVANFAIASGFYFKIKQDIVTERKGLLNELKQLPVGTIFPIALPLEHGKHVPYSEAVASLYKELPRNWVVCDGSLVNHDLRNLTQDEADSRYWNTRVPDLTSCFLRGATTTDTVGSSNGFDAAQPLILSTTPGEGAHSHSLPKTTGSCDDEVADDPGNHPYYVRDHGVGFTKKFKLATQPLDNDDGQHRHKLGGTIDGGPHQHTISVDRTKLLPPYVTVIYIIRIK